MFDGEGHVLASGSKKVDLCPDHGIKAQAAIDQRKAEKKTAREAKKAKAAA